MTSDLTPRSYRGYGLSEGKPSEQGLQLDAQAALDYLHTERTDIDRCALSALSPVALLGCTSHAGDCTECVSTACRDSIAIVGRSLGGAVAIHLAARNAEKVPCRLAAATASLLPLCHSHCHRKY